MSRIWTYRLLAYRTIDNPGIVTVPAGQIPEYRRVGVAVAIAGLDKDYIDRAHPVFYWDISPDNWYYYDVVEASTSHEHTGNVVTEQWTSHSPADTGISTG